MGLGSFRKLRASLVGGGVEILSATVAGAAANTPIATAGITTKSQLLAVLEFAGPGEAAGTASVTDVGAQTTIPSAGNIQVSVATNASADRRLVVIWAEPK